MNGVKHLVSPITRRLACSPLAGLFALIGGRGMSPVPFRWISAGTEETTAALLQELSAAATSEIVLVEGKAPEWITLIPAGTFSLVDGRGPFRNFDPEAIISASNARRGNTQLPGDYDHHIDNAGTTGIRGIASGWVEELKAEDGAVRARVRWTDAAAKHLAASEYRYISPRFGADENGNVLCVVRFALTNNPAIKDLPAIAAHERHTPTKENDVNLLQRLAGILAISASVTEDQLIDLVRALHEKLTGVTKAASLTSAAAAEDLISALRNSPDATKFVSAADHQKVVDELAGLKKATADANTVRLTAEISAAVEAASKSGHVIPAQKAFWISACTKAGSVEPLQEYLKTAVVVMAPQAIAAGRLPPAGGEISAASLDADQLELCRVNNITPERFAETRNAQIRAERERA